MTPRLQGLPDERLTELIKAGGDEGACAELFRRYRQRIYLWCFRYTHDADEALECTQEVFIRIFRGLDGFAGRARFSTWAYQVARNYCLRALQQNGERWRRRLVAVDEVDVEDHRCGERLREAELAGRLDDLLSRAGTRMEADELEAFLLHYREGLTVKEITRTLGCENLTGARTLIQNARRKFQRLVRAGEDRDV